jgi:ketosteroid isomerase-like protein
VANNAQTIIELDRKRMQAMSEKDLATLEALLADDLIYTHSSARVDTKQSLIANMKSGSTVYSSIEPSDVKAQDLGDTVVLTGVAWIKVVSRGNQLDVGVRFTDAYAKRDGRWQMVVWHSTRLPTD